MPDHTTPGAAELLSPQLLAQAIPDTKRRWSVHALCASTDPEIFFPPGDSPGSEARQICARCPVRRQCLAYAVAADEPAGIWGGLDPAAPAPTQTTRGRPRPPGRAGSKLGQQRIRADPGAAERAGTRRICCFRLRSRGLRLSVFRLPG
jgi:hypothetical protein